MFFSELMDNATAPFRGAQSLTNWLLSAVLLLIVVFAWSRVMRHVTLEG